MFHTLNVYSISSHGYTIIYHTTEISYLYTKKTEKSRCQETDPNRKRGNPLSCISQSYG